jgi:hypothetical protein
MISLPKLAAFNLCCGNGGVDFRQTLLLYSQALMVMPQHLMQVSRTALTERVNLCCCLIHGWCNALTQW